MGDEVGLSDVLCITNRNEACTTHDKPPNL